MTAETATDPLSALTGDWLEKVKIARKTADVGTILSLARDAVEAIEQAVGPDRERPAKPQLEALKAVKRITYNCAADAWPGWALGTPQTAATLAAAQTLARHCLAVVQALDLDATQHGNAVWLIGAFDLAQDRPEAAYAAFSTAADHFSAAKSPVMTLMAQGYMAIAAARLPAPPSGAPDFDSVLAQLAENPEKDAAFMSEQLITARQVYPPGQPG